MSNVVADLVARLGLKPDESSFKKGDKLIGNIKAGIAAFVGVEAVKAIGDAVMATVELGGHLDDLTQKTGLSAEALQEWGGVAKLGGSDMDSFAGGVQKLALTFHMAGAGSKEASEAIHEAGLTSGAVAAALKGGDGLDAALMEISSRFADMPDGPKKTALAMKLFGKSGVEMIPTLNEGAQGIAELRKEFAQFEITGKDVKVLDKFGDDLDKAKMSITGLKNQAIAKLIPVLQPMLDAFTQWVSVNREIITSTIQQVIEGLISAFKFLGRAVGVVVDIVKFFIDNAELGQSVLIAFGVVLTAWAVSAVAAWVAAAAPIILIIAAIAALAFGLRMLIKHWDKVKTAVRDAVHAAWQAVKDAGSRILKFFAEDIPDGIAAGFQKAWDAVVSGAEKVGKTLRNLPVIKQLIDAGEFVGGALGNGQTDATFNNALNGSPFKSDTAPARTDGGGPSAMAAPITIQGGDVKVEIGVGSGDPLAIMDVLKQQLPGLMTDHLDTMLQQTVEAIG